MRSVLDGLKSKMRPPLAVPALSNSHFAGELGRVGPSTAVWHGRLLVNWQKIDGGRGTDSPYQFDSENCWGLRVQVVTPVFQPAIVSNEDRQQPRRYGPRLNCYVTIILP